MKIIEKNDQNLDVSNILGQMTEARPLPMGREEFHEWADRIISGTILPGGEEDPDTFKDSMKFSLANMLLHLGPTESHKPDAFFIHSLRKFAVNQVAVAIASEIKMKRNEKAKQELAMAGEECQNQQQPIPS